jgi:hypothetical protein
MRARRRLALPFALLPLLAAGALRPAAAQETAPPGAKRPAPTSPAMALDHAAAAYEYGDLEEVVGVARAIVEGAYGEASPSERAEALRLLGVGLYLGGRLDGAEAAFVELLELRPRTRLDRATTRPEVVAYFEDIRRRRRRWRSRAWAFLPPLGQIQNGDTGRAWLLGSLELVSLAAATTTFVLLERWEGNDLTFAGHRDAFAPTKAVHLASAGLLAATYAAGVVDALLRHEREDDRESGLRVGLVVLPTAATLRVAF